MRPPRYADKVLYLDFDGVLQHENVLWHPRRGIYIGTPGYTLFEWMSVLDELLAPHPDVAIVLSTSWVRVRGFGRAKQQLSASLQARVIGATFHRREMRKDEFQLKSRGLQILEDAQRRQPKAWLALDDDDMGWPQSCRENLIRTDGARGISDPEVQDIIRVKLTQL